MTNLDVENRVYLAFRELLLATADIAAVVSTRVYRHGSAQHISVLPAVTINIPSCAGFESMLGWYKTVVQLVANIHIRDDENLDGLNGLVGKLRGFCQSGTLETSLNNTTTAKATTTALTVVDAEYDDVFEGEENGNARAIGATVTVVCRPSIGANTGS